MKNDGIHKLSINRRIELQCTGNACLFPKDTYKCGVNLILQRIHPHDVTVKVDITKEPDSPPPTWEVDFGE